MDPRLRIVMVVADKVERHVLKGLVNVNGKYGCEVGTGRAKTVGGTCWPYPQSLNCPLRTHAEHENICRNHLGEHEDVVRGVLTDSPLLDLPGFDPIWDVPIEEFHLIKEGLTKLMMERMLDFSNTDETRRIKKELSDAYAATMVFSETSRRARPITRFAQFKGSELGTLTFSAFPTLFADIMRNDNYAHW